MIVKEGVGFGLRPFSFLGFDVRGVRGLGLSVVSCWFRGEEVCPSGGDNGRRTGLLFEELD